MAKFTKLSFSQKLIFWHKTSSCKCSMCLYYVGKYQITSVYFYGIILLRANVQCVYIVYTKYQDVSVKAVEQVEFPVHALPMQH